MKAVFFGNRQVSGALFLAICEATTLRRIDLGQ
jgi:hypothetical protein